MGGELSLWQNGDIEFSKTTSDSGLTPWLTIVSPNCMGYFSLDITGNCSAKDVRLYSSSTEPG